jgi:chromatin remodeling complex protein RSC6
MEKKKNVGLVQADSRLQKILGEIAKDQQRLKKGVTNEALTRGLQQMGIEVPQDIVKQYVGQAA